MAVNDFNDSFRELVVLLHLLNYTEWFNISLDCQRHRILMHCKKSLSFYILPFDSNVDIKIWYKRFNFIISNNSNIHKSNEIKMTAEYWFEVCVALLY